MYVSYSYHLLRSSTKGMSCLLLRPSRKAEAMSSLLFGLLRRRQECPIFSYSLLGRRQQCPLSSYSLLRRRQKCSLTSYSLLRRRQECSVFFGEKDGTVLVQHLDVYIGGAWGLSIKDSNIIKNGRNNFKNTHFTWRHKMQLQEFQNWWIE